MSTNKVLKHGKKKLANPQCVKMCGVSNKRIFICMPFALHVQQTKQNKSNFENLRTKSLETWNKV
jgi:hypothetical protein